MFSGWIPYLKLILQLRESAAGPGVEVLHDGQKPVLLQTLLRALVLHLAADICQAGPQGGHVLFQLAQGNF